MEKERKRNKMGRGVGVEKKKERGRETGRERVKE